MAGIHVSEWAKLPRERQQEIACAMTREELNEGGMRCMVYHCAAMGYSPEPRRRRRPIPSSVRFLLADRYGCSEPGAIVKFVCRCGSEHVIHWLRPFHPKIKKSKGWIFFVGLHIDHVRPVSLGGSDDPSNLQLLCARCNLSKYNRWVG
jgi:hypothetical protein